MTVPSHENYIRQISLVDRSISSPVTYVKQPASAPYIIPPTVNNLSAYLLQSEVINTGNDLIDNARFTFRIDGLGTFIRSAPILTDENAKLNYLIDFKILQGSEETKLFRFEISQAIIQEDESYGEVLVLVCRGREYVVKENFTSRPLYYVTPKEAFQQRIFDFNGNPPSGRGAQVGDDSQNFLPTEITLKSDYIPAGPISIFKSIQTILDRVALPASSGGVLKDYYWDATNDPDSISFFDVEVREFGSLPVADSDRVRITPTDWTAGAEQKDKSIVTDNQTYKNQIILRGSGSHGSLPMDYVKYASNLEHAKRRPIWKSGTPYKKNDAVKVIVNAVVGGYQNLTRFFKCKSTFTSTVSPVIDTTNFTEDFCIYPSHRRNGSYQKGDIVYVDTGPNITYFQAINATSATNAFTNSLGFADADPTNWAPFPNPQIPSNFTPFVSFTPWTNNADEWLSNSTESPTSGFRGAFVDWNFVRANYDRKDWNNEFENVTQKWVTRQSNTQPNGAELFHGQRILVGSSGTLAGWTIAGNAPVDGNGVLVNSVANKIAQLDLVDPVFSQFAGSGGVWKISSAPVNNDIVTDLASNRILRFNGSSWVSGWSHTANFDKTSPIHPFKEMYYTNSPDGTPNQAIEFEWDWNSFVTTGGSGLNAPCKGAWLNFWFPFPRLALNGTQIGQGFGGTSAPRGTFDTDNMELSRLGLRGWNRGTASEDMGRVNAIAMKLRLRGKTYDDSDVTFGIANMPMLFWAVDLFDRVFFYKFTLKKIGSWEDVIIPFGRRAGQNLYVNRINEVIDIAGWAPIGQLNLKQKEHIGVTFDWNFVKGFGIQWLKKYDESERYNINLGSEAGDGWDSLLQIGANIILKSNEITLATDVNFAIRKSFLGISDLRFIKELYVNSEDANVSDARTEVINRETEIDYNSAKLVAQGYRERTKFFPQTIHIRSFGDVRLKVGHRFLIVGDKVPSGQQEMVIQSVKHIIDGTSYKTEIEAKRKFVLP